MNARPTAGDGLLLSERDIPKRKRAQAAQPPMTIQDTTERGRIEDALRESETRFRALA